MRMVTDAGDEIVTIRAEKLGFFSPSSLYNEIP